MHINKTYFLGSKTCSNNYIMQCKICSVLKRFLIDKTRLASIIASKTYKNLIPLSYVILFFFSPSHFHQCSYFPRICDRHRRTFRVLRISLASSPWTSVDRSIFLLRCYRSPNSDPIRITIHTVGQISLQRAIPFNLSILFNSCILKNWVSCTLWAFIVGIYIVSSPRIDRKWRVRNLLLGKARKIIRPW